MFRCSECGAEFEIKPDYCDCGNDIFEEIIPQKEQEVSNDVENVQDIDSSREDLSPKNKFRHVEQAAKPSSFKINKSIANDYSYTPKEPMSKPLTIQDYLSWGIFALCLILSIVIIIIPVKSNPTNNIDQQKTVTENSSKDIPNIDSLWNNKVPAASKLVQKEQQQKPEENKIIEPIKNIIKIVEPKKTVQTTPKQTAQAKKSSTQKKTNTTKTTKVPLSKNQNTSNQTQKSTSGVNIDLQKILNNANTKTQNSSLTPSSNLPVKATATTTPIQKTTTVSAHSAVPKTTGATVTTQSTTVNKTAQKQELANYKAALRNTIGKRIDFTRVVGDGTCTVAFKINSAGKLVNRSFAVQSQNITLNDAVYNAIMATPSYSAPPSGYNNETMYLKVTFTNGNFNITLN